MAIEKEGTRKKLYLQVAIIAAVVIPVIIITIFTDIFSGEKIDTILGILLLGGGLMLIAAVAMLCTKAVQLVSLNEDIIRRLDKVTSTLEKNRSVLNQINASNRVSERAREIAFREADLQLLKETVYDKLHQQDFDSTYKMIEEISDVQEYAQLASVLRAEADRYRDATDQERENQVIAHIEKLLDNHQWGRASQQIERLIWTYPDSEKAKAMRRKLFEKKQERKRVLLNAWNEGVKRQDAERGLAILKELDAYLTPNEAMALQEAASDVFRTKLQNLGVRFSLAVSEKNWKEAVETGQEIMREFPNSRMCKEIRENIETLRQKARTQKRQ